MKKKHYTLGTVKWTIEIDNNRMEDINAYGLCVYDRNIIYLQDRDRGKEAINETMQHEVIHSILNAMGESDLCKDERFVQGFAVLLNQYIKTLK
jgi:Zn-dependent peptidase ImmA (M78 family)